MFQKSFPLTLQHHRRHTCVWWTYRKTVSSASLKRLLQFFLSASEAYLKKKAAAGKYKERQRYRAKCPCTNTSNTVPEVIKYFFVIIQALFYLLTTASATFISIPVTAFPFSRNLSSSCCFDFLFMFINLRLSECRNKDELLQIIWDCWMSYLLLFKSFGICSCNFH